MIIKICLTVGKVKFFHINGISIRITAHFIYTLIHFVFNFKMVEEPPRETLLQFEPPQEVAGDIAPPKKRTPGMSSRRKGGLPPLDAKPSIEDILHAVLPPREWLETGRKYVQYVSA